MSKSLELVYAAVDQVNAQAADDAKIVKDPSTALLDGDGGVDSLALVNLVVALEQLVFDETEQSIAIVDEDVYSSPESPFRTLGSLAAYLEKLLA
jgi:acyl carrier protein